MFTDKEKQIAKSIVDNEDYVELLAKVLLTEEDKFTSEVIQSKTNEELGEYVRANDLAEQKVKQRFNRLKMAAEQKGGKPNPAAKK